MNPPDRDKRLRNILNKLPAEDGKHICRLIYSDPLAGIYWLLLIIYACILAGFLLWPFDFDLYLKNDARWIKNARGIEFLGTGQAVSNSSTQEFFDHMVRGSGLTLELWLETEDQNQFGPARILSYSIDSGSRNFTIGQSLDQLVVRLRTTETSLNGTNPHLIVDSTFDEQACNMWSLPMIILNKGYISMANRGREAKYSKEIFPIGTRPAGWSLEMRSPATGHGKGNYIMPLSLTGL